jgi:hypothetical protein
MCLQFKDIAAATKKMTIFLLLSISSTRICRNMRHAVLCVPIDKSAYLLARAPLDNSSRTCLMQFCAMHLFVALIQNAAATAIIA